jgi:hypothetical protein
MDLEVVAATPWRPHIDRGNGSRRLGACPPVDDRPVRQLDHLARESRWGDVGRPISSEGVEVILEIALGLDLSHPRAATRPSDIGATTGDQVVIGQVVELAWGLRRGAAGAVGVAAELSQDLLQGLDQALEQTGLGSQRPQAADQ